MIDLLHAPQDPTHRTVLFATAEGARIEITRVEPAVITVGAHRTRHSGYSWTLKPTSMVYEHPATRSSISTSILLCEERSAPRSLISRIHVWHAR